jgi:predicted nucleic acid-binding protein
LLNREDYQTSSSDIRDGQSGLSAKDALHLACASQVGAACFVTCDDGLIRQAKRLRLALAILNPVDYVRQVGK